MVDFAVSPDASRMDRHYRYQRFVYDATRRYFLLGRKHLIGNLKPEASGSVLEIGCGTAWNLTEAARLYPDARFFGLDVSAAMLETARASLARKRLGHPIVLRQGDATGFDAPELFGVQAFDRVFFSYALSMIPGWELALDHALDLIMPGGSLHIVDFGQCEHLPGHIKRGLFAFLSYHSVTPRSDLKDRILVLAEIRGFDAQYSSLYRDYAHYAVISRRA